MSNQTTFKNIEATEALKNHIDKKIEKFSKFVPYPIDVKTVVGVEKQEHWVEINIHAEHKDVVAKSTSKDLYESIDSAVHKIETQLRKEREKRKGHKTAHAMSRPSAAKLAHDVEAEVPHMNKNRPVKD